jgi:hypothetical protein
MSGLGRAGISILGTRFLNNGLTAKKRFDKLLGDLL